MIPKTKAGAGRQGVGDGLIKLGKVRYLFLELRGRGETFLVHLSLFGNRISVETYVTSPDRPRREGTRNNLLCSLGGPLPGSVDAKG